MHEEMWFQSTFWHRNNNPSYQKRDAFGENIIFSLDCLVICEKKTTFAALII